MQDVSLKIFAGHCEIPFMSLFLLCSAPASSLPIPSLNCPHPQFTATTPLRHTPMAFMRSEDSPPSCVSKIASSVLLSSF